MEKIKKVLKIIIPILILLLLIIFSISYTINKNKNYEESIEDIIKNNYGIKDKITYKNIYGNYYILTTKNNVIVLNKEYEEVLKENINILSENKNNYELIYKTSKLMYENTIIKKNTITYEYYDIKTYKKTNETILEKK